MAGLSEQKMTIVRTLVETAPDRIVGSLQQALSETPDGSALGGVRRLVETEMFARTQRNAALLPIVPMCIADGDPRTVTFPPRVLSLLWRALRVHHPELVRPLGGIDDDIAPQLLVDHQDTLLAAAAIGVREATLNEFVTVAQVCDRHRPDGAAQLAGCLQIGAIVRRATLRMPEWLDHRGGDTTAAVRLCYKDAVALADDAGPRFFHMLAAQMAQPWMVLRIISTVMDKPTERYLRDSELSSFGEAVFDDVDEALSAISRLDPDGGVESARNLAKAADLVVHQVKEIETGMDLQRDQGWGLRVVKQRASLANVVEGRLREAEKVSMEALPMLSARQPRGRRPMPHLGAPPEPRLVGRAMALLSFCEEIRTTANYGGFASARTKMVEKLSSYIDQYVEDVLDMLRSGEADDPEIGTAYLHLAADLKQLLMGGKAGDLIRRRAFSAIDPEKAAAAEALIAALARA